MLMGCNSDEPVEVTPTGSKMDNTVSWVNQNENGIEAYFTDDSRKKLLIRNMNMEMVYYLRGTGSKKLEYIKGVGEKNPALN